MRLSRLSVDHASSHVFRSAWLRALASVTAATLVNRMAGVPVAAMLAVGQCFTGLVAEAVWCSPDPNRKGVLRV